ncbi:MAG: hypothetical protein ACI4VE_05135 [Clostridia bacterium]
MAKHSKEKITNKSNNRALIIFAIFIILLLVGIIEVSIIRNEKTSRFNSIKDSTTIEGERLVFKSTLEHNRIIESIFKNNILETVKIYQQFENSEDLEKEKEKYLNNSNITILNINEEERSIEIQKNDFGSDTGKSYEEIYDKYLVQIIGAYTIIE